MRTKNSFRPRIARLLKELPQPVFCLASWENLGFWGDILNPWGGGGFGHDPNTTLVISNVVSEYDIQNVD